MYIICNNIVSIYEIELYLCNQFQVEEFENLQIGSLHKLPIIIDYFCYNTKEIPYKITLQEIYMQLNSFLIEIKEKKENIERIPNLCLKFIEYIIEKNNYDQPERLGLIIRNIDEVIKVKIKVYRF